MKPRTPSKKLQLERGHRGHPSPSPSGASAPHLGMAQSYSQSNSWRMGEYIIHGDNEVASMQAPPRKLDFHTPPVSKYWRDSSAHRISGTFYYGQTSSETAGNELGD
jgi:hypothetical protein